MTHAIVVATDGSPESITAARWAAGLAGRLGEPVTVLDILQQPYAEMPTDDVERFQVDALEQLNERLREADIHFDESVAIVGDVDTLLIEASQDASMLVLGSAERVGWGRHGHFSLVHALAHHVACPIVVIPNSPVEEREPVVIVGIDGSRGSRMTLEWAIQFGARAQMRVIAAFVVNDIYTTFSSAGWYGKEEAKARIESATDSVELIERFGADPAVSLEAIAAQHDASLLVVGAKQHHSLSGVLLGAIPDELLHHPTCPIAVIPRHMTNAPDHDRSLTEHIGL
ncbi:MAG: universal stress protein [Ilumatobacteraceae bacterium]